MTLSVSQLNNYIKGLFDFDGTLDNVTVCGEITNVKAYSRGWYFSLKDEVGAINCFTYATEVQPVSGSMAVVFGKVNYLVKSGSVSLYVKRITLSDNKGAAYLQFLQLKEKLDKEGLFSEARKQPVPHCCAKVGVVTSATGAVIHDITNVCLRRQPFTQIVLYPVKVQGVGADKEICQGIRYFSDSDVDVVIVGRGGGSNEDLSVFNSEDIVRAIAACNKPVVSAVGHGVDFTLCDFVADRRAVTPSEAAEFVTIDVVEARERVRYLLDKANTAVSNLIADDQHFVANTVRRLNIQVSHKIEMQKATVMRTLQRMGDIVESRAEVCAARIQKYTATLSASNPTRLLQRGYTYAVKDGKPVKSVGQLATNDEMVLRFTDGNATVSVKNIAKS